MENANLKSYALDELEPGMSVSSEQLVSEADIVKFAEVSGDDNPLHLDADYAATTLFGQRIAHGMLGASYISALLGTRLPGAGSVYVSQQLKFKAPVCIGDSVRTTVKVREVIAERKRVVLDTYCEVGDKKVLDGEAVMMVTRRAG